jgi:drug/metabolite transporter (DMT)-like permease
VGVLLGLSTALSWGCEDYLLAISSRRIGALLALLGLHIASISVLTAIVLGHGTATTTLSWDQAAVLVAAGLVGGVGYLCFLRALVLGPVSIVSAIVSGYAIVILLWAIVVLGERPGPLQALGVAVTLAGVLFASLRLGDLKELSSGVPGLWLSLIATVTLGSWIFAVQSYGDDVGIVLSLLVGRGSATVLLLSAFVLGGAATVSSFRMSALAVIAGLLDTIGYVLFQLGTDHEQTGIVAVASSTYFLVPVALGVWLLRERPALSQWCGITLIVAGLTLLGGPAA